MSDYLSSLVARSLRREPACEPRRPQMFEPRQETPGAHFVGESSEWPSPEESFQAAASETTLSTTPPLPGTPPLNEADGGPLDEPRTEAPARTFVTAPPRDAGGEPDARPSHRHTGSHDVPRASATHSPLNATPDSQPVRTRPSEGTSPAPVRQEQSAHPVATVRESSPHIVARLAETRTPEHEPSAAPDISPAREVFGRPPAPRSTYETAADMHGQEEAVTPRPGAPLRPHAPTRPQSSHDSSSLFEPEGGNSHAPVSDEPQTVVASSHAPSLRPLATADEGVLTNLQAPPRHGVGAEVLDEGGREQTSAVAAQRVGRVESKVPTTVVDVEAIPRPRTSMPSRRSESSTGSSSETPSDGVLQSRTAAPSAEVRPAPAQPRVPNVEVASPAQADRAFNVRGSEVGFEGVRSAAGELRREAAPVIEVTIGRIEVRAVTPPAPPQPTRRRQEPPKMSLDDYLRSHGGGRT